jgi:hypothetical protein
VAYAFNHLSVIHLIRIKEQCYAVFCLKHVVTLFHPSSSTLPRVRRAYSANDIIHDVHRWRSFTAYLQHQRLWVYYFYCVGLSWLLILKLLNQTTDSPLFVQNQS